MSDPHAPWDPRQAPLDEHAVGGCADPWREQWHGLIEPADVKLALDLGL